MCVSKIFKAPKPKLPDLPPAPKRSDTEIQAAAEAERRRARAARGRASTLLTGGQGDPNSAPVSAKTLLGG